jgi:hypothetical protein
VLDDRLDLARRHVKAHVSDVPRSGDSKDLDVEVAVSNPTTEETAATPRRAPRCPFTHTDYRRRQRWIGLRSVDPRALSQISLVIVEIRVFSQSKFVAAYGDSVGELQVREHEVLMQAAAYKQLFKRRFAQDDRAQPWKRGIVKMRPAIGNGSIRLLYRSAPIKGLGLEVAVAHDRTFDRLAALARGATSQDNHRDQETRGFESIATGEPRVSGRFLFYWDHPDDQARAAFKLGVVGVILGVLALPGTVDSLVSLVGKLSR